MALIRNHCLVEFTLDECVKQVRSAMILNKEIPLLEGDSAAPSALLVSRIRSWSPEQFALLQKTVRDLQIAKQPDLHRFSDASVISDDYIDLKFDHPTQSKQAECLEGNDEQKLPLSKGFGHLSASSPTFSDDKVVEISVARKVTTEDLMDLDVAPIL